MGFLDRHDAGRQLARELERFRDAAPVVLALPRGGVPVAFHVAEALAAPLDLALVRKIGAPGAPEYAIGAVAEGTEKPHVLVDKGAAEMLGIPHGYIEAEAARQLQEIQRQRRLYVGDREPTSIQGRTVIVVDDGIATGTTTRAVLHALREERPERLVLAVPVAAPQAMEKLRDEADEVLALQVPSQFWAVGQYYENFEQTSDDEVIQLLSTARH
jgi:putative phosphoribosyl transferase